jgi:membrane protein YqaA with SNARE-associated domain
MGLLSWIPIIGSVITVSMGLLRVNVSAALLATFLGKFLRYLVLTAFLSLF